MIMNSIWWAAVIAHCAYPLYEDLRTRRIPNGWNVGMAAAGVLFRLAANGRIGLGHALTGGLVLFLLAMLLYMLGAIGGGDVKWFAALGFWCGAAQASRVLLAALLIAGAFSLLYFLLRNQLLPLAKQWALSIILFAADRRIARLRAWIPQRVHEMPFMAAAVPAFMLIAWLEGGIR